MRREIEAKMAKGSRLARPAKFGASLRIDPSKPTIMVVSHEASRTGAPILALNIATNLSKKYNVVNVILGGGALRDEFAANSTAMYELDRLKLNDARIAAIMRSICADHKFAYALVNSAESRSILPSLKAAGVPVLALLHEFASYTRPTTAFATIFENSDQVVFSTRITLENALEQCGVARGAKIHVLPQGKCVVPGGASEEADRAREKKWLDAVLRPGGGDREFVVLGAGTVEPRKAVDLFIECATRVIGAAGGGRFRFVWIGHGYNPEKDTAVSSYLADQIKRAGIQGQMQIVRPTSEIEYAYRIADILLLSSRLDPLPNVAIDALIAGRPVICFERTTGVADFLLESGLGDDCVARYLDTSDMANKVLALAADAGLLASVAARGREAALRRFDFPSYVAQLDSIASSIAPAARQVEDDAAYIEASGRFRADFFCPADAECGDEATAIRRYLEANRSGRGMRKPEPGFDPGIYAERHEQGAAADPYVRFLREGAPHGPWSFDVIDERSASRPEEISMKRVALHLHVHGPDALADVLARLQLNQARPDLFVSASAGLAEEVGKALEGCPCPVKSVEITPDHAGAIGALLKAFGKELAAQYDIIGHLQAPAGSMPQSKGSDHGNSSFLLEGLVGGASGGAMMDRILTAMAADSSLGIVYPDDPNVLGWAQSRAKADGVARRMGIARLPDQINFPSGGVFWVRKGLIQRFLALDLDWSDFPAAPGSADSALAGALIRLFGVAPGFNGWQSAVTNVRGVTR